LALYYAKENSDEVVVVLDDKTEAVIRELEAQYGLLRQAILGCDRRDLTHAPK
jgi:hypothetical protein